MWQIIFHPAIRFVRNRNQVFFSPGTGTICHWVSYFLHATKQNDASFLNTTISELLRLSSFNEDEEETSGRSCTVQLRCIIADMPMRSFLKRTKFHTGHWSCDRCIQKGETINGCYRLNNVDAPRRIDSEFLTYCVSKESLDEHIPNPLDRSPFIRLDDVGMVTSFGIYPMHTAFAGAFWRRICGFCRQKQKK